MLLQLGAEGWSEAQRASVLSDLQHTLAGARDRRLLGDAHPAAAPLATLAVELAADDTAKATVDIEVRDAVTHKRVRRDVDLSRIPDDGRAAAIAIEADELLRASWAEIALDTARARQAQETARPQVVGSVEQVLAPARAESGGGLGARAAVEHYLRRHDAGRRGRRRAPAAVAAARAGDRGRAALRSVGGRAARPGQRARARAAAWRCWCGSRAAARRRWPRAPASSAGWLEFRAEPAPGAEGSAYGNLLAVGAPAAGSAGWRSGARCTRTAGLDGGVALRGVEATDAGAVVARARGATLGATLGLEAP